MKKIDNKGFTLVEVIASVVILGILLIVLVPNVSNLLKKSGDNAYQNLKQSIIVSCKKFVNDNRYDIILDDDGTNVTKINNIDLVDGKVLISDLLELGYLSPTSDQYIVDPRDRDKKLVLNESYIIVSFDVEKRDYLFDLKDDYLNWE